MNAYPALITAGIIFAIIALIHVLRLIYKIEIVVAGKRIPSWVSVIGFVIPLLLSIWMFAIAASFS